MTDVHMPRLYLLQWLKSDRALMMLFNDGTFQVNTREKKTQPLLGVPLFGHLNSKDANFTDISSV